MSLISEIILIELSALIVAILNVTTINLATDCLLSGILTVIIALHIVFYVLNVHISIEDISLPKVFKISNTFLLAISKLIINLSIIIIQACFIIALIIGIEDSINDPNGFILLIVYPLGFLFYLILCIFLIFISNKLDGASNKYSTKTTFFPITIANIIASQLFFSVIQSAMALFEFNSLFIDIAILNNLFSEPVLYNFISNLLEFG